MCGGKVSTTTFLKDSQDLLFNVSLCLVLANFLLNTNSLLAYFHIKLLEWHNILIFSVCSASCYHRKSCPYNYYNKYYSISNNTIANGFLSEMKLVIFNSVN